MKILGIIIILLSIVLTAVWIIIKNKSNMAMIFLCCVAIFAGGFFTLYDRIEELSIPRVGTIKTKLLQAEIDARTISEIKTRVENQSATIDLVAYKASEAQTQINMLDSTINVANNKIDTLDELSNFVLMVTAAHNDNRYAFDSLKVLAEDINYPYYYLAWEAYISIRDKYNFEPYKRQAYIPWGKIDEPSILTLGELQNIYDTMFVSYKTALIDYVWERKDISKIDKMDFLIHVMKEDYSLKAIGHAGRYFSKESKQGYMSLATYRFIDWWKENRDSYLDK